MDSVHKRTWWVELGVLRFHTNIHVDDGDIGKPIHLFAYIDCPQSRWCGVPWDRHRVVGIKRPTHTHTACADQILTPVDFLITFQYFHECGISCCKASYIGMAFEISANMWNRWYGAVTSWNTLSGRNRTTISRWIRWCNRVEKTTHILSSCISKSSLIDLHTHTHTWYTALVQENPCRQYNNR